MGTKKGIKMFRYSGRPVTVENLQAHKAEFQTRYDEISAAYSPDMLKVHEELIKLDAELAVKWEMVLVVDLPKSKKAWKKLVMKYEAPVMVAQAADNPEDTVLVLMDEALG